MVYYHYQAAHSVHNCMSCTFTWLAVPFVYASTTANTQGMHVPQCRMATVPLGDGNSLALFQILGPPTYVQFVTDQTPPHGTGLHMYKTEEKQIQITTDQTKL